MNIGLIGKNGEDKACRFLKRKGYKIIERNYMSRFGEIDIIAQNKEYLVFVEVKTRGENSIASPREFVDSFKQERIIKTAQIYLSENPTELQPRFDVAEISVSDGKIKEIVHIEDAFCLY